MPLLVPLLLLTELSFRMKFEPLGAALSKL
jgi:hypothetical protein